MITGIKLTVVFNSYAFAANLAKDAHITVNTHLLGNRKIKAGHAQVNVNIRRTGKSNAEIAENLVLGESTVKTHLSNILKKLHLDDRTQAAVYAWQQGIVRRHKS